MAVSVNLGRIADGSPIKLFEVINTAFNHLYVLAKDKDDAMKIAYWLNHIKDYYEIHKDYYFRDAHEMLKPDRKTEQFWNFIERARSEGVQGSIFFRENHIVIGAEIFS